MTLPWQGPSCLHALYNLLLAPFEDLLPDAQTSKTKDKDLIFTYFYKYIYLPLQLLDLDRRS